MAGDKRTVLSTKRARDRRQRASRRACKKTLDVTPESDRSDACAAAKKSANAVVPVTVMHLKLADPSSSGEDGAHTASSSSDDSDDGDEYEDDELVIVCRATLPNFCTQFVPATHAADNNAMDSSSGSTLAHRAFTATIPAFRETGDGFTTYAIALSTCCEPRRHFQLERRFSEFVALAAALRASSSPSSSDMCRQSDSSIADVEEAQGEEWRQTAADEDNSSSNRNSSNGAFQWELPPKTWFKVTQSPALEERRRQLEQCLETLLAQDAGAMSRRALVRDFLMLDLFGAQVADEQQSQ